MHNTNLVSLLTSGVFNALEQQTAVTVMNYTCHILHWIIFSYLAHYNLFQ